MCCQGITSAGTPSGKVAILIHDGDFENAGFEAFMEIERELGVKSAFYPRPDADFYSTAIGGYQAAQAAGWEIGFQQDALSRSGGNRTLAMQLFDAQLAYMRVFFNVTTTSCHGDSYNLTINNEALYDRGVWTDRGLIGDVYSPDFFGKASYFSDSNNILVEPEKLGDLVLVQLHTDWTLSKGFSIVPL